MFERLQAREIAPGEWAVFMMNLIHGGLVTNIIPDHVEMVGNARGYVESVRQQMVSNAKRVVSAMETVSGCRIDMNYTKGYDPVYNDEELSELLFRALQDVIGEDRVIHLKEALSFSEDFSFYSTLTDVPQVYMILQGGHEGDCWFRFITPNAQFVKKRFHTVSQRQWLICLKAMVRRNYF